MTTVAITRVPDYHEEGVYRALVRTVDLLGGIKKFVSAGDRVLLKPNLLSGCAPERAVTTHPAVVEGVARMVLEAGGIPCLGDSPALASLDRVAEKSGMTRIAKKLGLRLVKFSDSVRIGPCDGRLFRQMEVARAVLEVDKLINLPKVKTHCQMLLSLGVKNLFGCVVGKRKGIWHLEAGRDRDAFALMLLELCERIQPVLTLVDGVIAMEGDGPSRGEPRHLGLLLGGEDCVALDRVMTEILQIRGDLLPTTRMATGRGYGETKLDKIRILGEEIKAVQIKHYRLPRTTALDFVPFPFRGLSRRLFTAMPYADKKGCALCRNCTDICPTGAILLEGKRLVVDDGKCIRCYCCQEVCPEGAIKVKYGLLHHFIRSH